MSPTGRLWLEIQDIIGNASLWPINIRQSFWTPNLRHLDRRNICCFVFVNGLNPELFYDWVRLMKLNGQTNDLGEFKTLLEAFERDPKRYKWYAYCVAQNQYRWLDGTPKPYVHASVRNQQQ